MYRSHLEKVNYYQYEICLRVVCTPQALLLLIYFKMIVWGMLWRSDEFWFISPTTKASIRRSAGLKLYENSWPVTPLWPWIFVNTHTLFHLSPQIHLVSVGAYIPLCCRCASCISWKPWNSFLGYSKAWYVFAAFPFLKEYPNAINLTALPAVRSRQNTIC